MPIFSIQSGDGIVRAVEEAAEEIIRDLVDAGHLDWAGSEIEAAPLEQQEEETVIPARSTTTTTTTRTTTMSTTTSTTATTTSTAQTSTASQAQPEATTTIPPSSPSADLALLPRLLVRNDNDGVVDTPAFLTANDLPIFASPPPPPPPKRGDAAAGRRRPSPVVEMNQGGTDGSGNYKLVATSSDLLAGSGAEAAKGQHRHHRPWVVFSALRMAEADEGGHSGESFEVFREQHHESDRSVPPPPLAELGSLFPQGKKEEEEVTIVTPEPQQLQLQPQQQHLGIMEPFGGANLNKVFFTNNNSPNFPQQYFFPHLKNF